MKKVTDSILKLLYDSGVCKAAPGLIRSAKYATMILPNLDAKSASWHIIEQRSVGVWKFLWEKSGKFSWNCDQGVGVGIKKV